MCIINDVLLVWLWCPIRANRGIALWFRRPHRSIAFPTYAYVPTLPSMTDMSKRGTGTYIFTSTGLRSSMKTTVLNNHVQPNEIIHSRIVFNNHVQPYIIQDRE